MVTLNRWNWERQCHERIPANEAVLQEIVDYFFASNERWLQEVQVDPSRMQMKLRRWVEKLYDAAPVEQKAPEPVAASGTHEDAPQSWPEFLSVQRMAGRSMKQAGEAWRARKAAA